MRAFADRENHVIGEHYDTLGELYRVNEARPLNKSHSSDRKCGPGGVERLDDGRMVSWQENREYMLLGSDMFADECAEALERVKGKSPAAWRETERPRAVPSIAGGSAVVPKALMGHPKAFMRRAPERARNREVSVMYSISCSSFVTARERVEAGCVVMAVCSHLERRGHQVRLLYAPNMSFGKDRMAPCEAGPLAVCLVTLKDYRAHLSPWRASYPLASSAALFLTGCWWYHRYPDAPYDYGSGEGVPPDADARRLESAKRFALGYDSVYLSVKMVRDMGMDPERVYDYVAREIEKM